MPPPLLRLPDEAAYRRHYVRRYCKEAITTHDGIRTYFHQGAFEHAFYESSDRDGAKDVFSRMRAERMDWIGATLANSEAIRYQGWTAKNGYDPARRVDLLYEEFVVVLGFGLNRSNGALKANFITCYRADNSIDKIRTSPLWTRKNCLDALR